MQNFEFKSWKSLAILIAICVTFLILVIQAFQYIPEENKNNKSVEQLVEENYNEENAIEDNNEETIEATSNEEEENQEEPARTSNQREKNWEFRDSSLDRFTNKEFEISAPELPAPPQEIEHRNVDIPNLESINENTQDEDKQRVIFEKLMQLQSKANEYKWQKDYDNAIVQFESYLKLSQEQYQKLEAYDNLAILYAMKKNYEKAIYCAKQAYQIEASPEREFLLTKLYYKSGDVDKATKRINMIMQREFELK